MLSECHFRTMTANLSETDASNKSEFISKIPIKHDSSYNKIKKLPKKKIYTSIDGQEKSAKFPEIEVESDSNLKMNELDETELLKIMFRNEARSLDREKEKVSVEIERLKFELSWTELKRAETACQMVIEQNRNSEIRLHNERRELYAQQKINDIEEYIKRR